ncbi:MAG: hypothetical protein N2491_03160 [Negativicutes bacterium]|nr:hypothetical protein [Negativicutes bacterium]
MNWWLWRNVSQVLAGIMLVAALGWVFSIINEKKLESSVKPGWKMVRSPGNLQAIALYRDAVWAGGVKGLFRFDRQAASLPLPAGAPRFGMVYDLFAESGGRLWIAHDKGIAWYDGAVWGSLGEAEGVPAGSIYSVMRDRDGALWLGLKDGVLCISGKVSGWGSKDGFAIGPVDSLYQDLQGRIWAGSSDLKRGGLASLSSGRWQFYSTADGLVHSAVNCIVQTRDGIIWIGTGFANSGGANRLTSDGKFASLMREHGLAGDKVRQIYEDDKGYIWFCSEYDGAALFKYGRRAKLLTTTDGLAGQEIKRIIQDEYGIYWLATDQGLNRIEHIN